MHAVDPSVRWPIYDYVSYFDAIIKVLEDEGWIPGFNRECLNFFFQKPIARYM